ncbi:alcohol dehydrogenase catalytic domain-containing protein [Ammoniphilus sp. 3BR4]|uniref:alcohol dehydrogenase catalytic domain-containing protein n=1 Tax=Ammoniphilus sp. 3BR4 TaxID=3158265 RepID=UPI003464FB84
MILGHEGAGEVVEVGSAVKHLKIGDRVGMEALLGLVSTTIAAEGIRICALTGNIYIDFDGTFAKYIAFPSVDTNLLPESISYDQAAYLEPISIVVHAMENNLVTVGDTVAIVGPGPLGLFTLQAAKSAGAAKVMVVGSPSDEYRLQIARDGQKRSLKLAVLLPLQNKPF